ncbi:MAG: hypothetical protein WCO57_06060 [Verrucomicrobiota bacterium]
MGFIANLFVREDRFATLLEAATSEVQATVKALDQLLTSPNPALSLASFVQARAKEQEIKGQIDVLLCQRGASRLDHGDLVALALGLNRISKGVRRFAERHMLCAAHIPSGIFAVQVAMLEEAAATLQRMVVGSAAGAASVPPNSRTISCNVSRAMRTNSSPTPWCSCIRATMSR